MPLPRAPPVRLLSSDVLPPPPPRASCRSCQESKRSERRDARQLRARGGRADKRASGSCARRKKWARIGPARADLFGGGASVPPRISRPSAGGARKRARTLLRRDTSRRADLCIRSIEALLPGAAEEGGAEGGGSNAARQAHPRPSELPRAQIGWKAERACRLMSLRPASRGYGCSSGGGFSESSSTKDASAGHEASASISASNPSLAAPRGPAKGPHLSREKRSAKSLECGRGR